MVINQCSIKRDAIGQWVFTKSNPCSKFCRQNILGIHHSFVGRGSQTTIGLRGLVERTIVVTSVGVGQIKYRKVEWGAFNNSPRGVRS